jgi:hypothetical protein
MVAYRIVSLFLAVALYFLSSGAATAGVGDGVAAFQRGDYETAFRELMPLAVAGNPTAQFGLGVIYLEGYGVPQDHAEAVRWFRLAANQGVPNTQYALGVMYQEGKGVLQDHSEAARWYRLAADQGNADAQLLLGLVYVRGQGVPQDFVLAYMWINLGMAELPAGTDRASWVESRAILARKMTPAQLARAQEMARNWRPRLAASGGIGSPAYADTERAEPPRTQRHAEPNPFRAALELQARQNREVQRLLGELGYDPGPADGVIGPRTRAAVRAFQTDAGLPVDGEISDELYAALSEVVSSGQRIAARSVPTERRLDSTGTGFAVSQERPSSNEPPCGRRLC